MSLYFSFEKQWGGISSWTILAGQKTRIRVNSGEPRHAITRREYNNFKRLKVNKRGVENYVGWITLYNNIIYNVTVTGLGRARPQSLPPLVAAKKASRVETNTSVLYRVSSS